MPISEAQRRSNKKVKARLYAERKAAGTCTHCGMVPEPGFTHCRAAAQVNVRVELKSCGRSA